PWPESTTALSPEESATTSAVRDHRMDAELASIDGDRDPRSARDARMRKLRGEHAPSIARDRHRHLIGAGDRHRSSRRAREGSIGENGGWIRGRGGPRGKLEPERLLHGHLAIERRAEHRIDRLRKSARPIDLRMHGHPRAEPDVLDEVPVSEGETARGVLADD